MVSKALNGSLGLTQQGFIHGALSPTVHTFSVTQDECSLSSYSVKIAPGAVVCVESEIRGDVTIGKKMVDVSRELMLGNQL